MRGERGGMPAVAVAGTLALVSTRARVLTFGGATLLFAAGVMCLAWVGGATGAVLASVLMALGFGAALLLVFYEVGLGEDRERAREEERRREQFDSSIRRRDRPPRPPRRPA